MSKILRELQFQDRFATLATLRNFANKEYQLRMHFITQLGGQS
jgi:hypothetical protein